MTYVIGTAGHVDHGKSRLVQALTGIDPDRLAEEKARQMTIDLGFAWLTLPGGETLGIVDVPGHQDFIENMLAGVGGIDLALLVIAADEGIMPQTREHLAILDLLAIPTGIIALTKIDLISDPTWQTLVLADIAAATSGTAFQDAPIARVSAQTGEGLPELLRTIEAALASCAPRPDLGRPRLPVDRVFTMSGFGTVATGTLSGGTLAAGDAVEIAPAGLAARVRGLQSHRQAIQMARPGNRVAVNLSGVGKDQVRRGDVIALPGALSGTTLIDVSYRHHREAGRALAHGDMVKFFSGAAETTAQVRLLGDKTLAPGDQGWLQLRLDAPLALDRGDRFILRFPSPAQTLGGGMVIEAHPEHRWRRFKPEVLARFEALARGRPEDILLELAQRQPAAQREALIAQAGVERGAAEDAIEGLAATGDLLRLAGDWLVARSRWDRFMGDTTAALSRYHAEHPLRQGMPKEALRSQIGVEAQAFGALTALAAQQEIIREDSTDAWLPEHAVRFSEAQAEAVGRLETLIAASPMTPPSFREAAEVVGEDVLRALIAQGRLVQIGAEVLFDAGVYQRLVEGVGAYIRQNGSITVAQARDHFGTSRKYVTALLEHLDEIGVTRRVGDERMLR